MSSTIDRDIRYEIYKAFEGLGAGSDLLSIIGSWKDTLSDDMILRMLIEYNQGEDGIEIICEVPKQS